MYTKVKTQKEIEAMRESGRMWATVMRAVRDFVDVDCTGKDVAALVRRELKALGGKHAFFGYEGFPDVICISVNDEVVHGIPNDTPFASGDIVSLDYGVDYKGMITDAAISVIVGTPQPKAEQLLIDTERSLQAGIAAVHDGVQTGDIGAAVEAILKPAGYGIIRDLVGHGVGHAVHEEPNIPNYGKAGKGEKLQANMTIAIEPMATLGGEGVYVDRDGWTIRTKDGSLSAHFEHTILITEDGAEIITAL